MAICNNKKCSLGECDQAETCTAYIPVITNADRIRAMSDEELAKWLLRFVRNCGAVNRNNIEWADGMEEKMLDMLKQPADDSYCADGERRTDDAAD